MVDVSAFENRPSKIDVSAFEHRWLMLNYAATLAKNIDTIVGASLSEPHLDELAGAFLICIYIYSGIHFIGFTVKQVSRFIGPFYLERNHISTYVYKITYIHTYTQDNYIQSTEVQTLGAICIQL